MGYKSHPLVEKLSPSGSNKQIRLIGYLGETADDGTIKLYLDLTLSRYYLFSDSAISEVIKIDNHQFSPDCILVDANTPMKFVEETPVNNKRLNQLINGNIADTYLPNAGYSFAISASPMSTMGGSSNPCQFAAVVMGNASSRPCLGASHP